MEGLEGCWITSPLKMYVWFEYVSEAEFLIRLKYCRTRIIPQLQAASQKKERSMNAEDAYRCQYLPSEINGKVVRVRRKIALI